MTLDYTAEARRLGIDTGGLVVLCVSGCGSCRAIRDKVRAALQAEKVGDDLAVVEAINAPVSEDPEFVELAISTSDVERRFTYHRPEGQKVMDHDDVRLEFRAFADKMNAIVPRGREASLFFTALEEASFWAHAAIAREGK
jgi:hypothetical protein